MTQKEKTALKAVYYLAGRYPRLRLGGTYVEDIHNIDTCEKIGFAEAMDIVGNMLYSGTSVWIDARQQTPPDQEEVLVCTRSKNGVRNIDKGYYAIDRYIHRGSAEVTHWMPLPKLPEVLDK